MTRTASQRARDATAARVAQGGRVIRLILSPAAARALDSLTRDGMTMTAAIEASLLAQHLDSLRLRSGKPGVPT